MKAPNGGFLVVEHPWPGMLRGIWGDPKRFKEVYWSKWKDTYYAGDGAHRDKQGYFWIMGRVDDVMNISGHRIGTMEVESAIVSHADVAESAVVGRPDEVTGSLDRDELLAQAPDAEGGYYRVPRILDEP